MPTPKITSIPLIVLGVFIGAIGLISLMLIPLSDPRVDQGPSIFFGVTLLIVSIAFFLQNKIFLLVSLALLLISLFLLDIDFSSVLSLFPL